MLREDFLEYAENYECIGKDIFENDCNLIIYMLENCEITVPEENEFFVRVSCGYVFSPLVVKRASLICNPTQDLQDGQNAMAYTGLYDFGHTSCEWESVIKLGMYGLKKRADDYVKSGKSEMRKGFYKNVSAVYGAALSFMERAAVEAEKCGKTRMAQGLKNLCVNSPSNLYEAMQTTFVYFVFQQVVENTILRTFGRVDKLFFSYYIKEEKEKAEKLVKDFVLEADRLTSNANNIPFALGGTDEKGNSLVNELSYAFLNTYKNLDTSEVKLHLLINDNTPADFVKIGLDCVRKGKNSIVFMSDKKIIESLEKIGADKNDATDYHVVGCYECGADGEVTCSCNARVNIPKAVEYALNGGKDVLLKKQVGFYCSCEYNSFSDFFEEVKRQLIYLCRGAMRATDLYEEKYNMLHASPFFSGTYTDAMEKGGDIYCDFGAKYNNSSVNGVGLATAIDSLAAIRKLVFEDKTMSLSEFNDILIANWENNEVLRLTIKNKFPKYGTGDKDIDCLVSEITNLMAKEISNKPNKKGGVYRLGFFSIDWRWEMGEKTGASADGRMSGEPLSQNSGATFGADTKGVLAHLMSSTAIDASCTPNGTVIDIDLHPSAVEGKDGLEAFYSVLKTYFKLGGFCVHYNVLDAQTLKDAVKNPERYKNLQVRLCGWNVLFNNLSEQEKEEFVKRAEVRL